MRRGRLFGGVSAVIAVVAFGVFASSAAAKLIADYRFDGNLSSSVPGAPALTNIGAGNTFVNDSPVNCSRRALQFPQGNGVKLATANLPQSTYTVVFLFRLDSQQAFNRLLNFDGNSLNNDDGLYVHDDQLSWVENLAPTDGDRSFPPDTYVEIAMSRNAGGVINAYVNGVADPALTLTDNGIALLNDGALAFFKDNTSGTGGTGEESGGAVARIRIYNTVLEAGQVANTKTTGCPAPPRCGGRAVTIPGDGGNNVLVGTKRADVFAGGGGRDVIRGLGGKDIMCGNGGGDRLVGGGGNDRLLGGKGKDRLNGGKGRDVCRGGPGADRKRNCEAGTG